MTLQELYDDVNLFSPLSMPDFLELLSAMISEGYVTSEYNKKTNEFEYCLTKSGLGLAVNATLKLTGRLN